jgi:hypothetical protein
MDFTFRTPLWSAVTLGGRPPKKGTSARVLFSWDTTSSMSLHSLSTAWVENSRVFFSDFS